MGEAFCLSHGQAGTSRPLSWTFWLMWGCGVYSRLVLNI